MKSLSANINFAASAFLALACQGKSSAPKNVFGNDDRVMVSASHMPYSGIGRLDQGCTAAMIGNRLLLTAAHCIVGEDGKVRRDMGFYRAGYENGQSNGEAWMVDAWVGSLEPEKNRPLDWAIVRLDQAVGANGNFFHIDGTTVSAFPYQVALAGYSRDKNNGNSISADPQCQVMERFQDRYFHNCDAAPGISGAPILANVDTDAKIVGLTASEFRDGANDTVHSDTYARERANVGVPASQFSEVAQAILAQADGDVTVPVGPIANAIYIKNDLARPANSNVPNGNPPAANNPGGNNTPPPPPANNQPPATNPGDNNTPPPVTIPDNNYPPASVPGGNNNPPAVTFPDNNSYPPASGGSYPPVSGGSYPPVSGGAYPPASGGTSFPSYGQYPGKGKAWPQQQQMPQQQQQMPQQQQQAPMPKGGVLYPKKF